ncbi:DMT family transporter [Brucella pituitosa]|uniref:DMT family transporter n=1 Tax=Brucella pituitosa TaxID=571256 RepID=UPI001FFF51BC|nr:DMT family transporter [Brucella pituitosa]
MKNLTAMLLLALMWGLSIPITKLGLDSVPPITLTALRFMVAVPLMMFLARRELRVPATAVLPIIGLGVMGITLGNVAQSFGVQGTSASVATIGLGSQDDQARATGFTVSRVEPDKDERLS